MASAGPRLKHETFERLREQIATASALCSEDQLLELADGLHAAIRRRHGERGRSYEAPALQRLRERLSLSGNWPEWLTGAPFGGGSEARG
ncbi:hypothetical protein QO010_004355 [Caulobacter ginsengisoli]|uniref:Uncharacterized protein n=1 Tax=Caulobacter ginsengisoli TaxID=400775 RepID=A0ABU0IYZ4_9CAUL|nr:hypothetical protein [Caulobacter ginsengisoli]MDQ0466560.1 hypothetical protein [Caulobacter ginsengisoli]